MLGVIGGPLIFVSSIAVLFGAYEQDGLHALFSVPEGAFEAAFAIYLIVKGFRPSPILDDARFTRRGRRLPAPCGCAVDLSTAAAVRRTKPSGPRPPVTTGARPLRRHLQASDLRGLHGMQQSRPQSSR